MNTTTIITSSLSSAGKTAKPRRTAGSSSPWRGRKIFSGISISAEERRQRVKEAYSVSVHSLVQKGDLEAIELLPARHPGLRELDENGDTPLVAAIREGLFNEASALRSCGASVKMLISHPKLPEFLAKAVSKNQSSFIDLFLRCGVDPMAVDSSGRLTYAMRVSYLEFLMRCEADRCRSLITSLANQMNQEVRDRIAKCVTASGPISEFKRFAVCRLAIRHLWLTCNPKAKLPAMAETLRVMTAEVKHLPIILKELKDWSETVERMKNVPLSQIHKVLAFSDEQVQSLLEAIKPFGIFDYVHDEHGYLSVKHFKISDPTLHELGKFRHEQTGKALSHPIATTLLNLWSQESITSSLIEAIEEYADDLPQFVKIFNLVFVMDSKRILQGLAQIQVHEEHDRMEVHQLTSAYWNVAPIRRCKATRCERVGSAIVEHSLHLKIRSGVKGPLRANPSEEAEAFWAKIHSTHEPQSMYVALYPRAAIAMLADYGGRAEF